MFAVVDRKYILNFCIVIFIITSLLITCYIFSNSLKTPDISNVKSNILSGKLKPIIDPNNKISEEDFHKYVRKAAHFIEFLALGISLGLLFLSISKKYAKTFVSLPLFLSLSTGVTDEFIQSFTGRTSSIKDVLIDFSGAAFGLLLVGFSILLHKRFFVEKNSI